MIRATPSSRRSLVWLLRIVVLGTVCLAVSHTVRKALAQLSEHTWHLYPAWIVGSGALYVLGLMPMGWFWYRVLAAMRYPTPLLAALRGYFLSHLGKYVPGKAMSAILQVAAVREWVPSMRIAFVSVLFEVLTMMSVGAFLAAVISIAVARLDAVISLIALGMGVAAGVPTLPPVMRWLAQLGVGWFNEDDGAKPQAVSSSDIDESLSGIDFRLLAEGWLASAICWLFLGISLWAMLRGIGATQVGLMDNLPVLIAAAAFSVVAGFLSMLPAGIVVRDAALMQLLATVCGDAHALVAAVLMRLVWLVSEVVACGILYIGARSREQGAGSKNSNHGR